MDQRIRRLITMGALALVCLVLLTAPVPAQQRDPLRAAFNALSAHKVGTLRFQGFGATYAAGRRVPMHSYQGDLTLTPQGFLKAARANGATVRAMPNGSEVSFTADGQMFVGLLNNRDEVDRVHEAYLLPSFLVISKCRRLHGSKKLSRTGLQSHVTHSSETR